MKRALVPVLAFAAAAGVGFVPSTAAAQTIIDEWANVKAPPAPQLKPVTVDPKTTALLMLDFMNQNCGQRPRCLATIPAMKKLLEQARAKGATVIYTFFGKTTAADVLKDVAPAANEQSVTSFADKFLNTDLDKKLKDKGIQTVIVAGTAANGAVLYVGSGAALRGLNVIVPVDGISSVDVYSEQFSVWQLANGPTFGAKVTLTKTDMIKF
ncbi:MAG: cysteine hydrolase [Betaproteobacteria bacterium]|nr:cysteine hydrolase [Betaproteobacteria bacterium]